MRSIRVRATVLRRSLEPLLELISSLIWRPAFRRSDFNKLKRQAAASLAARRDDDQTLGAIRFREALFGSHPYGRTLSGTPSSLRRIGLDDARRFYRRHLERQAFVVGIAGDVADGDAQRMIAAYLPPLRPTSKDEQTLAPTRARRGRRVVIVDKPDRTQTQLFIGTLGARTRDPKLFPLIVSNTAFGGTFSGPLMQQIRGVRGWSYGAYSRLLHSTRRDAWYMWTAPASEYSADCAGLQLELLERWVQHGARRSEIEFAKRFLINGHCFDRDTPSKRVEASLDVELLGIPRRYIDAHDELITNVTTAQANQATRARISSRDVTIVVVATASAVASAFEALPGVRSVEIVPFERV
jgi:zinc protease